MTRKKGTSFDGGPVGYKRPPVEHQFKPGERPKGSGRRRGSSNYDSIITQLLDSAVTVTVNGKGRTMPAKEALLRKAFASAVNGNTRDIIKFFDLVDRLAPALLRKELQPILVQMMPGDENL